MKGLKKMLLGVAFLMIALMGTIMYDDFGYVLFIIGAPLGLIFCIIIINIQKEQIKNIWFIISKKRELQVQKNYIYY